MSTTELPKVASSRRPKWRVVVFGLAAIAAIAASAAAVLPLVLKRPRAEPPARSAGATAREGADRAAVRRRIVHEGIEVELTIEPINRQGVPGTGLREGDDVVFRFKIADTTSGAALKNVYPAAWLTDRSREETRQKDCVETVQVLIGGSLLSPPELDLNVYHVVTLNEDATLTVIDPRFGFGGTKLLAVVSLAGVGQDWALSRDEARLFVSIPEVGKVAIVDTSSWTVTANLEVGPLPTRVAPQPDGAYVWVAHDPAGASGSLLTAIDVEKGRVVATVPVGRGPHEMTFGGDGGHAFVTNAADGTVSVIDTRALCTVGSIAVGRLPTYLAYSPLADMVYVTDPADGTITVLDAKRHRIVSTVREEPGLGRIAFAPGGRLGFMVNPRLGRLSILDAASNRLIQSGTLREEPDQVAFSDDFAYIRHRGTEHVVMVPLAQVGQAGRPIPTVDFPAGQNPLGRISRPTPAQAIVQAPGENAVLVANPSDKSIYYYKEGMAAPMGSFNNDRREPRAVLVVDRSLRDRGAPGVYETVAHLRRPGAFNIVFFLSTPRIINCFPIEVASDPALAAARDLRMTTVEPLLTERSVKAGEPTTLRYRLSNKAKGSGRAGLPDVLILALSPGGWQTRLAGRDEGDGVYSAEVVFPNPGFYYISVGSESIGLSRNQIPALILEAHPAGPAEARSNLNEN
jgi:YVTN family beta-propeller protein